MKNKSLLLCALLLALSATAGTAQETSVTLSESLSEKLSIHGYLTQAYAESDGHQLIGITSDGTSDYRTAALQFRYNASEKHNFVVQFSHEALGDSPFDDFKEDIEVDWAFYQYHFKPGHSLKAGRVQIPFGIYNEIRDAGRLLPFYRPPVGVYLETLFGVEAVDGLVSTNSFGGGNDWALDADFYYGEWDFIGSTQVEQQAEDAFGVQLWLYTPVSGLRFGAAYREYDSLQAGGASNGMVLTTEEYLLSADGTFNRFLVRAELQHAQAGFGDYGSYYGQVGVHVTDKLSVYGQAEYTDLQLVVPFLGKVDLDVNDDVAFAVTYSFGSFLLRAEHHWNTGLLAEDLDTRQIATLPPVDTEYLILSLSASF